ncbi:variant leucine-rich repeat-containing protein [Nesterenkonia populi]
MTDGPQDAASQAADPSTSAQELYELAADRPELRAQIAEHPNAYQGLLDWLGTLGDPDVDAALARRVREADPQATQVLPDSGRQDPQQTQEFGAVHHEQPAQHGVPPWEDQTAAYPQQQAWEQHQQQGYYPAAPASGHPGPYPPQDGYGQWQQPEAQEEERRSPAGMCALLALLVLMLVGALVAVWALFLSGDDDDEPVQEPPAEEQQEPDDQNDDEAEEEQAQPVTPQAPEFDEEDGVLTIPDIEGVQYSVEGSAASGEVGLEPGESVTVTAEPEDGYEFLDDATAEWGFTAEDDGEERPAPGNAATGDAFSAPSGNIHCELGSDDVTCTIDEHDFSAPSGCEDATTVSVGTTGSSEPDCGTSVSSQPASLDYGLSMTNGDFACTSDESGVECWSVETGNGFTLARETLDLYDW